LRVWLKNFELQLEYAGIPRPADCIPQFGHFMPQLIKNFLPTMSVATKASWELFKEELLLHFGKPEEEENKELYKQLR
ncbi:hypothetical protein BD560DRAFT_319128, partial [Blakeslea trispora]